MKKFTSTGLGGAPIFKDDLKTIFNDELWAVIQAMLSAFDSNTEGLVISGCVTTANAGNFDMTAGIVYLNGEFMRIAAVTNQSFTKYIAPSTAVNDTRTFEDSSSQVVAVTKGAELVGSAPGAGQYLTIASLTDLDNRRWKAMSSEGVNVRTKIIEIGDWDMDADATKQVTHGLDFTKIRSVSAVIRNDAGTGQFPVPSSLSTTGVAELFFANNIVPVPITSTVIVLARLTGGGFDDTAFDSTSYNRGWITIVYEV